MPRILIASCLLIVSTALSACVDPTELEGLVVALPPSTPDNANISPIIVKAPRAANVKYRYIWTSDSPDWGTLVDDGNQWGPTVGSWATLPGETWSVEVVPYLGDPDRPVAEGPSAFGTTLITDAGRETDNDGDGWTENAGDCDDFDRDVFPGVDRDNDGFVGCAFAFGGTQELDCDDGDSLINPGRARDDDAARPLQDDDCDGIVDEDGVGGEEFVITEVMTDPMTAGGGWIEVRHVGSEDRELRGWTLEGGDGVVEALGPISIEGAGVFVLCPAPPTASALGVPCANSQGFSDAVLAGDWLRFGVPETAAGTLMLQVLPLGELPTTLGVAAQLDAAATASAVLAEEPERWCPATTAFGDELGTPGAANVACPER